MPLELPHSPTVSCTVRLCVCASVCLSVLADIQNNVGNNTEAEIFLSVLDGLNFEHLCQSLAHGPPCVCVYVNTISAF